MHLRYDKVQKCEVCGVYLLGILAAIRKKSIICGSLLDKKISASDSTYLSCKLVVPVFAVVFCVISWVTIICFYLFDFSGPWNMYGEIFY